MRIVDLTHPTVGRHADATRAWRGRRSAPIAAWEQRRLPHVGVPAAQPHRHARRRAVAPVGRRRHARRDRPRRGWSATRSRSTSRRASPARCRWPSSSRTWSGAGRRPRLPALRQRRALRDRGLLDRLVLPGRRGVAGARRARRSPGIGFDGPSADPVDTEDYGLHRIWLEGGRLILENLANLDQLPPRRAGGRRAAEGARRERRAGARARAAARGRRMKAGELRRGVAHRRRRDGAVARRCCRSRSASRSAPRARPRTAGITVPLAYLIAGLGCLCLASVIARFTRRTASAGGLYTYIAGGLGPRAGLPRRLAVRGRLRVRDLVRARDLELLPVGGADRAHRRSTPAGTRGSSRCSGWRRCWRCSTSASRPACSSS